MCGLAVKVRSTGVWPKTAHLQASLLFIISMDARGS